MAVLGDAAAGLLPPVEQDGIDFNDTLRRRSQLNRNWELDNIYSTNTAKPATVVTHTIKRKPVVTEREVLPLPAVNTERTERWHPRLAQEGQTGNSSDRSNQSSDSIGNTCTENNKKPSLKKLATSDLVLQVAVMEEVHGVDVSWLHRPNKDTSQHRKAGTQSSPDVRRDLKPQPPPSSVQQNGEKVTGRRSPQPPQQEPASLPSPHHVAPPPTSAPASQPTPHPLPITPTPSKHAQHAPPSTPPSSKRPSLLNRPSAERLSRDSSAKKSSWMNSLSSKFSSSPQSSGSEQRPGPTPMQAQAGPGTPPIPPTNGDAGAQVEEAEPYTPAKPKESSSSFFSSLTRRLSAGSQASGIPKVQGTGGVCARRVLNVDPNRERCLVPEMDSNRLRRVSFCVDVEIAGGPRYVDEEEDDDEEKKKKRKTDFKMKEKAEGAALKNPVDTSVVEEKDMAGEDVVKRTISQGSTGSNNPLVESAAATTNGAPEADRDTASRKKEKKQKSEAERKDRKEKRRRKAEESGSVPVELMLDGDDAEAGAAAGSSPPGSSQGPPQQSNGGAPSSQPPLQPQPNANAPPKQDRPTTDPARIYRRCCQLRESPILKRITEQLSSPKCLLPQEPGVVNCLDLTGSRLQLADVVTLGDWLAVVPIKVLKLENADLNDEGIRCILAGLLAAKRPEPTKRRSTNPKHRDGLPAQHHRERAGVIEKINMKNNPRISRVGWKHISLFIYMCRSLRAIDVSMNSFPESLPPSAHVTPIKSAAGGVPGGGQDVDAAEALYQCLAQRLGGQKLEEFILSECGLNAAQVRKIVNGAIVCGISRLGLAGSQLDDEGLGYVLHYLRSGTCQALDLGGTDLRGKLSTLADALSDKCWGLSLADCNLDSHSLKPLFAALVKLPSFRFLDLSHNPSLCTAEDSGSSGLVSLLRRYIGQLPDLKRIHLADVGMSPKQAIALADALPDGPRLAHLSLLENPQLTALANARTEDEREEACALYASLMAAVRVSSTIICVDVDVPSADNSDVVKALAKQVVAYSLRNMEQFAIAEVTGGQPSTANAMETLTGPHGGEKGMKDFTVPDVLMHLVGHSEGAKGNHDNDDPAPDEDYIVGGTGVVKALQYVLSEKANDSKRTSLPPTPTSATPSGAITPNRPGSSGGIVEPVQAKKMSKNLLGSARKIRERLQPALVKEAHGSDEFAYKRLQFLDQTLQSMIERFEEEYPETRLTPIPTKESDAAANKSENSSLTDQSKSVNTPGSELATSLTDEEDADADDEAAVRPTGSRKNSDVGLASRTLGMEEGRLHRLGQQMRREVLESPGTNQFKDVPWQQKEQEQHLKKIGEIVENISGVELRNMVDEEGWDSVLRKIGANYDDLRQLQEQDPEAWEAFRVAQEKARLNM